jgi:hypothetical protein
MSAFAADMYLACWLSHPILVGIFNVTERKKYKKTRQVAQMQREHDQLVNVQKSKMQMFDELWRFDSVFSWDLGCGWPFKYVAEIVAITNGSSARRRTL